MNAPTPTGALAVPTIAINEIVASPSNPRKRFDDAYLVELAESIKAHGLIQPITVRPISIDGLLEYNHHDRTEAHDIPRFEIVVGECRWRASKLAGLTEIPAFWRELDDKQVLEIQVIENLQRRDVHPIEEADGYAQLINKHGYRAEDIGEKIGKSRSYIYARMKLASLCQDARTIIVNEKIDASIALMIARLDAADQISVLKSLRQAAGLGNPMSFRDAKYAILNGFIRRLDDADFSTADATLVKSAGSCDVCPKRSGNAPELCPDIAGANVCTDTKCFRAKSAALRTRTINEATKRGIQVYAGDDADQIAPHGTLWSIDRDQHVPLDDTIPGEEDERTYREVLGGQAPVMALVEVHSNNGKALVEVADAGAMAAALKAAGVTVAAVEDEGRAVVPHVPSAERQRQREEYAAARAAEEARRADLREAIQARLVDSALSRTHVDRVVAAVACAALRQDVAYGEWPEDVLSTFGIETPEEYDETEELDKACVLILTWPVGTVLALLAAMFLHHEHRTDFRMEETVSPAPAHDTLAKALNLLPEASDAAPADAAEPVQAWPWQAPGTAQPEEPTASTAADHTALAIGDRVRIKQGVRGPNRHFRKVCGREGVIESEADGIYSVRLGAGRNGLAGDLRAEDLELLGDAT